MADDRAEEKGPYDKLSPEQKTLVNDRILDELRNNPAELAKYNLAIKEAFEKGASKMDAFQAVLDARRDTLATAMQAGEGGFPKYSDTLLASNGKTPSQDLANSRNILRQIGGQLAAYNPAHNKLQFTNANLAPQIDDKREEFNLFSSVQQKAQAVAPEGVCVAPLEGSVNTAPPRGEHQDKGCAR